MFKELIKKKKYNFTISARAFYLFILTNFTDLLCSVSSFWRFVHWWQIFLFLFERELISFPTPTSKHADRRKARRSEGLRSELEEWRTVRTRTQKEELYQSIGAVQPQSCRATNSDHRTFTFFVLLFNVKDCWHVKNFLHAISNGIKRHRLVMGFHFIVVMYREGFQLCCQCRRVSRGFANDTWCRKRLLIRVDTMYWKVFKH